MWRAILLAGIHIAAGLQNISVLDSQPAKCNGHQDLCGRRYSNVTYVMTHNSAFHQWGNPASNQWETVETQLNDGARGLHVQTHKGGVIHMCHTRCWILDAGPLEDFFRTVQQWMVRNPSEVVTIIIGNADELSSANFSIPLEASGLADLVYEPPKVTMDIDDWPTLGTMVQDNKRVVVMIDYHAQGDPRFVDEFEVMWETPSSPTRKDFPCSPERPPNQEWDVRQRRMYLTNHNLNMGFVMGGVELLVPDLTSIKTTNAETGEGSLGLMVERCIIQWRRSPNFVLVDFYREPDYSVFKVAAEANGLVWERPKSDGYSHHHDHNTWLGFVVVWMILSKWLLAIC